MPPRDDHLNVPTVERSLLAGLMIDADALTEVSGLVQPTHLADERHRLVYAAMLQAAREGTPLSLAAVKDTLQRQSKLDAAGGEDYLGDIYRHTATAAHVEWCAKRIVEAWRLRTMIAACRESIQAITAGLQPADALLDGCLERMTRVVDQGVADGPSPMARDLEASYQAALAAKDSGSFTAGVSSGYPKFDRYLGGLQRGNLIVLAARTGMGKTALALNIAANVASDPRQNVVVFSMEMTRKEIADRILAREAGLGVQRIALGQLDDSQRHKLAAATVRANAAAERILLDASGTITPAMIRSHVRRLQRRQPIGLVIVDYLQLVTSGGRAENQNVRIGQISRELKSMAMDLQVPVLALSQFSREAARRDGEPQLSDLRDSGSIENDANAVVFIHHEDFAAWQRGESDTATIIIAKNRNGQTGHFKMHWLGYCVTFAEFAGAQA